MSYNKLMFVVIHHGCSKSKGPIKKRTSSVRKWTKESINTAMCTHMPFNLCSEMK